MNHSINSNSREHAAKNSDSAAAGEMPEMSGEMAKIHAMLTAGSTVDERDWRLPAHKRAVIFAGQSKSGAAARKSARVPWVQIFVAAAACYVFGMFALWLFRMNGVDASEVVREKSPDFIFYLNQKERQRATPLAPKIPVVESQGIAIAPVKLEAGKPAAQKPVQLVPSSDVISLERDAVAREKWQKEEEARKQRELLERRLREQEQQRLAMPPVQKP